MLMAAAVRKTPICVVETNAVLLLYSVCIAIGLPLE